MADEKTSAANRTKRHLASSKEQVDGFAVSLARFLEKNISSIAAGIREGKRGAIEAASVLNRLEQEIVAAGLPDVIAKVARLHAAELQFIKDEFEEIGIKKVLADIDRAVIETLIEFDTSRVATHVQAYLGDVKATMMRSIIGGQSVDTPTAIDAFTPKLEASIKTELNTSLSAFNRSVTKRKAKELGLEKFIYLGPDDSITRPFCRERVGNIYTLDEIDSWDNDTDLPADIYLGGYNCRHQLRPVR